MVKRALKLSKSNSFFLFGSRGSGKSTLIQREFPSESSIYFDLLDPQLVDDLRLNPKLLTRLINSPENQNKTVVIDEVQKLPKLLDLVHQQIHNSKRQFILTGSSSRKLKQASANMLAGRAWVYDLFPFSTEELAGQFNLNKALEQGGLPEAYLSSFDAANEYLRAYVLTYIEKEIQQEQWVRQLDPFRRFLPVAAQMNGKIVNRSKVAQEIGSTHTTVTQYFEILEETLLGFHLPAFHRSIRKSQRQSPKFYFIDPGVKRALDKTLTVKLVPQTYAFGDAFEHWVILEVYKRASYARNDWKLFYLRTKDGVEIDLVIERPGQPLALVEVKSKEKVSEGDARHLEALGNDLDPNSERYLLSLDKTPGEFGKTQAHYWSKGMDHLFR